MDEIDNPHPCEAYDLIGLTGETHIKQLHNNLNYKLNYIYIKNVFI